jgi:hypothetical protein
MKNRIVWSSEKSKNLIMCGGCGMEDWQIEPFISDSEIGVDPDCENAKTFRRLIDFHYE